MLIIYRDGEVQNQIVAWGGDRERHLDGKSTHRRKLHLSRIVSELEAVLTLSGAIIPTALPGDGRTRPGGDSEDESEDERQRLKDQDSGSELDM